MLHAETENLIRRYLLGQLSADQQQQIEEQLLADDEYAANLMAIEDELLDDYARGALSAEEQAQFEQVFLSTPKRRQKLAIAQALVRYATEATKPVESAPVEHAALSSSGSPHRSFDWRTLFFPGWKLAVYAVLLLGIGLVFWRWPFGNADVAQALAALNRAYQTERPLEARITGMNYAQYSVTRGAEQSPNTYRELEEAEVLLRKAVRENPTASTLHALGRFYLTRKEFDKAIAQMKEALKTDARNAGLHSDLGAALLEKGKASQMTESSGSNAIVFAESLEHCNQALALESQLLAARFNRALVHQALHLPALAKEDWKQYLEKDAQSPWADEARRHLQALEAQERKVQQNNEQWLEEFLRAHQTQDEAQGWQALQASYLRTGNFITETLIDRALAAPQAMNDRAAEALQWAGRLAEQHDAYLLQQARFYQTLAPPLYPTLRRARQRSREGYDYYRRSLTADAIQAYSEAQRLFQQTGNEPESLLAEYWLGYCFYIQAEGTRSQQVFQSIAARAAAHNYQWLQAGALNGLALSASAASEYSTALAHSQQALKVTTALGDINGMLRDRRTQADLYRALGRHEDGIALAQQGLTQAVAMAAEASQVIGFYSVLAWGFDALALNDAALTFRQETVRLAETLQRPLDLSRYSIHLGLTYRQRGDLTAALRHIQRGLEISRSLPPSATAEEMATYALLNLGRIYRESGALSEAEQAFQQAIKFYEPRAGRLLLYLARKERLLNLIAQGDQAATQQEIAAIIQLFEDNRRTIREESNRNSFFENEHGIYDIATDFAYETLHDPAQAWSYTELSHARSLLDALTEKTHTVRTEPAPDLRHSTSVQPLAAAALQAQLPEQVQLLQYAVLENKLIIWVITRQRIDSRDRPVTQRQLTQLVTKYLKQLSVPPDASADMTTATARELYELLIAPVASLLDQSKVLCLVPDKILSVLPFASLLDRGQYLLEKWPLVYASSANVFLHCSQAAQQRAQKAEERILTVGNPRFNPQQYQELKNLDAAAEEARAIAALYPTAVLLTGAQAIKPAVVREMSKADVVHLALHHLANSQSPMFSKLILAAAPTAPGQADASALAAWEIYQLPLHQARLVVLSACETRAETYLRGEGVLSISRPFEAAGVPLVVASLWPVDSAATKELMIRLHRFRKAEGNTTIAALRQAQLQLIRGDDPRYRHPYYWASFIAVGGYSEF